MVDATLIALSTTDALGRLATRRDAEAWAVLIDRHGAEILRVARRAAGASALCDDICQETLLQVRAHAGQFQPRGTVDERELYARAWIMRIACRTAMKMIRTQTRSDRRDARVGATAVRAEPAVDTRVLAREQAELVRREVAALPEVHRDAVALRYFGDLAYTDIAESLQISEEAAKKRVQRGVDLLRARLAVCGLTLTAGTLTSVLQGSTVCAAEAGGVVGATSDATAAVADEIFLDEGRRAVWQALVNSGQAPVLSGVVAAGGVSMVGKIGAGLAAVVVTALGVGGTMQIREAQSAAAHAVAAAEESRQHAHMLEQKLESNRKDFEMLRRQVETSGEEVSRMRGTIGELEKRSAKAAPVTIAGQAGPKVVRRGEGATEWRAGAPAPVPGGLGGGAGTMPPKVVEVQTYQIHDGGVLGITAGAGIAPEGVERRIEIAIPGAEGTGLDPALHAVIEKVKTLGLDPDKDANVQKIKEAEAELKRIVEESLKKRVTAPPVVPAAPPMVPGAPGIPPPPPPPAPKTDKNAPAAEF